MLVKLWSVLRINVGVVVVCLISLLLLCYAYLCRSALRRLRQRHSRRCELLQRTPSPFFRATPRTFFMPLHSFWTDTLPISIPACAETHTAASPTSFRVASDNAWGSKLPAMSTPERSGAGVCHVRGEFALGLILGIRHQGEIRLKTGRHEPASRRNTTFRHNMRI